MHSRWDGRGEGGWREPLGVKGLIMILISDGFMRVYIHQVYTYMHVYTYMCNACNLLYVPGNAV